MKVTLLAGPPGAPWRGFLKDKGGFHLNLDPSGADYGSPGRAVLSSGGRQAGWRFIGSLDGSKNPIAILAALETLRSQARGDEIWIQLFPLRPTPVNRQLALACGQLIRPDAVLAPQGSDAAGIGWPVGAEEIPLEPPPPPIVQLAQRKARWVDLWDKGELHSIEWAKVQMEGCRLGSGRPIDARGEVWAEKQGSTLFTLSPEPLAPPEQERLMELSRTNRLVAALPSDYLGLICSFADQEGGDFAMGVVQGVDLKRRTLEIRSVAVPPAPVRILRLGSLRINRGGDENEDLKPWSV
jgi:hypothetical protein